MIPFEPMWRAVKHVLKPDGVFVTTASQPFTSALVCSNPDWFKYELIWCKTSSTEFVNAKNKPMKAHENILLFSLGNFANGSKSRILYNPQGLIPINKPRKVCKKPEIIGQRKNQDGKSYVQQYKNYPLSWCVIPNQYSKLHPTQKPVALYKYLVQTYTNPGDTVLDMCMGSGTTMIACMDLGREWIGIEKDPEIFETACTRIHKHDQQLPMFPPSSPAKETDTRQMNLV